MDLQSRRLAFWDTVGSVLWFFMDGCWMGVWPYAAGILVLPTIAANLYTFRFTERAAAPLAITFAMNSWLFMNIFWMLHDLGGPDALSRVSAVFLVLGVSAILFSAMLSLHRGEPLLNVLARFRRFRFGALFNAHGPEQSPKEPLDVHLL